MGGEVDLDRKEHNICFDHNAADIVINSGIQIYMGTWGITRQFELSMEECSCLEAHGTELSRKMAEAIRLWKPVQNWKSGPVIYDIFPIIHSFDPNCYTCEQKSVEIITEGDDSGKTVPRGNKKNIFVTTGIDAEKVKQMFMKTVFQM